MLQLPQDTTIRGPQQVQNDFESNATVASALTLLRQGGSTVTQGNLITLPVGGGLMYFEPVYVSQSAAGSSGAYPTLQGVLVYYDGQVGYGPTLAGALAQVFGTAPAPAQPGHQPAASSHGAPANATVLKYLQQAETYYTAGAGRAEERQLRRLRPGPDPDEDGAGQREERGAGQSRLDVCRRRRRPASPVAVTGPQAGRLGLRRGCGGVAAVRPIDAAAPPHGHAAAPEGVRSVLTGHPERTLA